MQILKHTLRILLGILTKFSVNPYYKPLSRFMIDTLRMLKLSLLQSDDVIFVFPANRTQANKLM